MLVITTTARTPSNAAAQAAAESADDLARTASDVDAITHAIADIAAQTGFKPPYALNAFDDLATDVRAGIARIKADPHLLHRDRVRGFIFDVATGKLDEVTL